MEELCISFVSVVNDEYPRQPSISITAEHVVTIRNAVAHDGSHSGIIQWILSKELNIIRITAFVLRLLSDEEKQRRMDAGKIEFMDMIPVNQTTTVTRKKFIFTSAKEILSSQKQDELHLSVFSIMTPLSKKNSQLQIRRLM
ncbi:hypothetical protein Trydic_g8216 [Trypoxylus dichotomus]